MREIDVLTGQDSEHKGLPTVGGNERGHGGCRHEPGARKGCRRLTSQLLGVLSIVSYMWYHIHTLYFKRYY